MGNFMILDESNKMWSCQLTVNMVHYLFVEKKADKEKFKITTSIHPTKPTWNYEQFKEKYPL